MAERQYGSSVPGLMLSLPSNLEEQAFRIIGRRTVRFPGKNPTITLGSDDKDAPNAKFFADLQNWIEKSKPFKGGTIFRIPTKAEQAATQKRAKQAQYLSVLRDQRANGVLDLESSPKDALLKLAEKAGVSTRSKGKILTVAELRERLISAVEGS